MPIFMYNLSSVVFFSIHLAVATWSTIDYTLYLSDRISFYLDLYLLIKVLDVQILVFACKLPSDCLFPILAKIILVLTAVK